MRKQLIPLFPQSVRELGTIQPSVSLSSWSLLLTPFSLSTFPCFCLAASFQPAVAEEFSLSLSLLFADLITFASTDPISTLSVCRLDQKKQWFVCLHAFNCLALVEIIYQYFIACVLSFWLFCSWLDIFCVSSIASLFTLLDCGCRWLLPILNCIRGILFDRVEIHLIRMHGKIGTFGKLAFLRHTWDM
jgi:hypothetical protein